MHLRKNESGYALSVRGKTGEARAAQAVLVKLKHRLFTDVAIANLQSDDQGQISLGELKDISSIQVALNGKNTRTWNLVTGDQTVQRTINASSEQTINIPFDTDLPGVSFALIELRGNQYFKDQSEKVSAEKGLISISPLEVGDYELLNQRTGLRQRIKVTTGDVQGAYVMGKWRTLEIRNPTPLYVRDIEVVGDKVRIHLDGNGAYARVHVLATRFQPRFDVFAEMAQIADIEPLMIRKGIQLSGYVAGRSIGEEYQYILERQFHEKYPGNMLTRPSLLLNPWALRITENDVQVAEGGEEFGRGGAGTAADAKRAQQQLGRSGANSDFANLDFLADGSIVLTNLAADKNGVVELDRDLFGDKHMLQIVAQNHFHALLRQAILPESPLEYRDLRLVGGLDSESHFAQQKRYTVLKSDEPFELQDISSAKFQHYDSLSDIYRYFVTLTGNGQLVEFGFLMDWPNRSDEEKLELYKRYACHEFNFFLMKKDPDYFESVIVPYVGNKMHKTFLDQYLLQLDLESWVEPWEFQRLEHR